MPDLLPDWFHGPADSFDKGPSGLSPLVLDLDGDGVEVSSLAYGAAGSQVYFDMDNDGFAERTAWATGGDGLLALDKNGNGKIDNQGELFGKINTIADGFGDWKTRSPHGGGDDKECGIWLQTYSKHHQKFTKSQVT